MRHDHRVQVVVAVESFAVRRMGMRACDRAVVAFSLRVGPSAPSLHHISTSQHLVGVDWAISHLSVDFCRVKLRQMMQSRRADIIRVSYALAESTVTAGQTHHWRTFPSISKTLYVMSDVTSQHDHRGPLPAAASYGYACPRWANRSDHRCCHILGLHSMRWILRPAERMFIGP